MVMVDFSLIPVGKGPSIGTEVARSLEIVDQSGLDYRLGPMGTTIEGTWDEVFGVVKQCFERATKDNERIMLSIKVDYRRDATGRLPGRVAKIEKQVGRKLRT